MITLFNLYLPLFFGIITCVTMILLFQAFSNVKNTEGIHLKAILIYFILWWILQGVLSYKGFYLDTQAMPPHAVFIFIPVIVIMVWMLTGKRKRVSIQLPIKALTLIHIVRIPVELVLFQLYRQGKIPEIMTFEGRNFDILSGLTAPFIYFLVSKKYSLNKKVLLVWNLLALALLINILVHAVLSIPSPFQQFAFDQPNIGVLMFPYIWLPSIIVPVVFYSHLVSIYKLLKE